MFYIGVPSGKQKESELMQKPFLLSAATVLVVLSATDIYAQNIVVKPAPPGGGATTIYRQVMPDGRVVYSDKELKGAKVDHTIKVDPPIKGNLWTTESGQKPVVAAQTERTPINKATSAPPIGRKKTADEAASDVIRAEMLLEDAKKRQREGVEPLPGERTGNAAGGSRLNPAYEARQRALAQDVAQAEAALRKATAERDALQSARAR
jgi:hypothetical protein